MDLALQSFTKNVTMLSILSPSSARSSTKLLLPTRLLNGTQLRIVCMLLIHLINLSYCKLTSNKKWHSHSLKRQFFVIQIQVRHLEAVVTFLSLINAMLIQIVVLISLLLITLPLSPMRSYLRLGVLLADQPQELSLGCWNMKFSKFNLASLSIWFNLGGLLV